VKVTITFARAFETYLRMYSLSVSKLCSLARWISGLSLYLSFYWEISLPQMRQTPN